MAKSVGACSWCTAALVRTSLPRSRSCKIDDIENHRSPQQYLPRPFRPAETDRMLNHAASTDHDRVLMRRDCVTGVRAERPELDPHVSAVQDHRQRLLGRLVRPGELPDYDAAGKHPDQHRYR